MWFDGERVWSPGGSYRAGEMADVCGCHGLIWVGGDGWIENISWHNIDQSRSKLDYVMATRCLAAPFSPNTPGELRMSYRPREKPREKVKILFGVASTNKI